MTLAERFLSEVQIGQKVEMVVGPKEIVGEIVSVDNETVDVRKTDGRTAIIGIATITYYELRENDEVEDVAEEPVAVDMPPFALNVFEEALVRMATKEFKSLIREEQTMLELGYPQESLETMSKLLLADNYMKGLDVYSIANRVVTFQKNMNSVAEYYFCQALEEHSLTLELQQKAVRRLQEFYVLEEQYEKYLALIDKYPNQVDLSNGIYYIHYYFALKNSGANMEDFYDKYPLKFTQAGHYNWALGYLMTHPDDSLADRIIDYALTEHRNVKTSKLVLQYVHENRTEEEFIKLRKEIFLKLSPQYTCAELMEVLAVGFSVVETEEEKMIVSSEDEEHEEIVAKDRALESVVHEYLQDEVFGLVRAQDYLRRKEGKSSEFQDKVDEFCQKVNEEMSQDENQNNREQLQYISTVIGVCGAYESLNLEVRNLLRNGEESELMRAIEKYDEEKVKRIIADTTKLKGVGYSDKEIEKFRKLSSNRAYPLGMADYDVGTRLFMWGFPNQASLYFVKVANNLQIEKRDRAINQLLVIYSQTKNYEMFEKYYNLLGAKQKKNEAYVRVYHECLYHKKDYKSLYDLFKKTQTEQPAVVYGALMHEGGKELRETLLEKAYIIPEFNYEFWKTFLKQEAECRPIEYRAILNHLLNHNAIRATRSIEEIYSIIQLDGTYSDEITEDMIQGSMTEEQSLVLPLILCLQAETLTENIEQQVYDYVIGRLNERMEDMEYRIAHETASVALRLFVDSAPLKEIVRMAYNGMDVYDMLPSAHDNYAKGKRLLMLGGDREQALNYLKDEINTSDDKSAIAMCGIELLKNLMEHEAYLEVIQWGAVLLLEKEVWSYSAIVLNVSEALEALGQPDEKTTFIEKLTLRAKESFENNRYGAAIEIIKNIETLERENDYVKQYETLLEKVRTEKINLDEDTFIGQANVLRYIKNDITAFTEYIKTGFKANHIEMSARNFMATVLLEVIVEENIVEEHLDFVKSIVDYNIPLSEHIVDMLYSILIEHEELGVAIEYFTNLYAQAEDDKKLVILARLQKMYETALAEGVVFNSAQAVMQMKYYTQQNASIHVRLCYIWLLAYCGDMEKATELLALIPEELLAADEYSEMANQIIIQYFDGVKPDIIYEFRKHLKQYALLRLIEHCKQYKNFVFFSKAEERTHAELVKDSSRRVTTMDRDVQSAIIKSIYETPTKFKYWYLYYLCLRNGDIFSESEESTDEILFCINTNLSILNTDQGNKIPEDMIKSTIKTKPAIAEKYRVYTLYRSLCNQYLFNMLQRDVFTKNQIKDLAKSKKDFSKNENIRKKQAEDYIHLLKTIDDKEDYIYIKSAMFLATNHQCGKYFYELFQKDLLMREPGTCIKMCIEMRVSGREEQELVDRVLTDLQEVNPDYENVISVLLMQDEKIRDVCALLQSYPKAPEKKQLMRQLRKYPITSQIEILDRLALCYGEVNYIRVLLVELSRQIQDEGNFEKMYQHLIAIIENSESEEELYEMCRMAVFIAVALDKNSRIQDILNLYVQRIGKYQNEFEELCEACNELRVKDNRIEQKLILALIFDDWTTFFEEVPLKKLMPIRDIGKLLALSKLSFLQSALLYANDEENGEDREEFRDSIGQAAEWLFGVSFSDLIRKLGYLSEEQKRSVISKLQISNILELQDLPQDDYLLETLLGAWELLHGRDKLISTLRDWMENVEENEATVEKLIDYFESTELLDKYLNLLFDMQDYARMITLREEYPWVDNSFLYRSYRIVALLLMKSDSMELQEFPEDRWEEFVNVILILRKHALTREIERICGDVTNKKDVAELVVNVVNGMHAERTEDKIKKKKFSNEISSALLKLLYHGTVDIEYQVTLIEKYGPDIKQNQYITIWTQSNMKDVYYTRLETENNLKEETEHGEYKNLETCIYLQEALESRAASGDYSAGIPKGELKRLQEVYRQLLPKVSENAVYRREVLSQIIFVASKSDGNLVNYLDYIVQLGAVTYYCYQEQNQELAYNVLFEALRLMDESCNRSTLEMVRFAFCHMLKRLENVEEILAIQPELNKALLHWSQMDKAKEYSQFYTNVGRQLINIVKIARLSSATHRLEQYQKLEAYFSSCEKQKNQRFVNGVYRRWSQIMRSEGKKISSGAVILLEQETKSCAERGKICYVVQNIGTLPAERIVVRAVFDTTVRCRENEKEIPILYGGDTTAIAFVIRCKEATEQTFKIELSYEIGPNKVQETKEHSVRIISDQQYEHIGNLYSVAPVTVNSEFYGREREKEDILTFLNDTTFNTSMVFHGLKRVGKTSMLRFIERTMRDGNVYVPVYKSAQSVGDKQVVGKMFVETIIDAMENLGLVDDQCRSYLEYDYDNNPHQLYDFYSYLQKSGILGDKRILFMADEIEELFDLVDRKIVNARIYKVLRVILQELTSIRFIFCGADHLTNILHNNHALADVFEITKRVRISRLDEDAMRRMIVEPAKDKMTYTDRAVDRIWYYTKGHTYYSKNICNKIIDILNDESRTIAYAYDVDEAMRDVLRVTEYFGYLGRFFSENDRQVIKLICDNSQYAQAKVSEDVLEEHYEGSGLMDSIKALEFKDILDITERGGTEYYQFSIEMFRLWYSKEEYIAQSKED